ncbi:pyrroline-5-carboxylate reductase family protein [Sphingomonas abietis]|uniref:Pyrroline-5-carboxylate reductase n=1 Tax=Sphingomonas abietis TaxID=3012344 RepID=A0ABY7NKT9_9SPHN|nr:pyrroline-5-carboxylate reductase [Sphingomonas abietis]WBO21121.1 pyrroline-5-carboxylate reductase [Sphingomonas abietis]
MADSSKIAGTIAGDGPIWLVGAGNMGGAMLRGWLDGGIDPARITVIRPSGTPIAGVTVLTAPPIDGEMPAVLVLAMKPQKLDEAVPALAPLTGEGTLIVSVLAGVEVPSLAKRFPQHRAIVRVMPNTPSGIGQGVMLLHAGADADAAAKGDAEALVAPLGLCEWFDDEALFGRASALSGCGPAFLFRFIDAMARAGEGQGLAPDQAARLALATVQGAAQLAAGSEESPATLADRVASPGGSTRAGLNVIDDGEALDRLMADVLAASARRNEEMAAAAR